MDSNPDVSAAERASMTLAKQVAQLAESCGGLGLVLDALIDVLDQRAKTWRGFNPGSGILRDELRAAKGRARRRTFAAFKRTAVCPTCASDPSWTPPR